MAKELTEGERKDMKEMGDALKEITKLPPKKVAPPKSQLGGSKRIPSTLAGDDIKVTSKPVVIETSPEPGVAGPGTDEVEVETPEGEDYNSDMVKGAVIEATARVIGKAMVLLTKFPEMDFTPEEIESLKEIWIPVMPSMSPTAMALVGTVVIIGSKLAVYLVKKGEQKSGQQTAAAQAA